MTTIITTNGGPLGNLLGTLGTLLKLFISYSL